MVCPGLRLALVGDARRFIAEPDSLGCCIAQADLTHEALAVPASTHTSGLALRLTGASLLLGELIPWRGEDLRHASRRSDEV